jgi:hypothetical protein
MSETTEQTLMRLLKNTFIGQVIMPNDGGGTTHGCVVQFNDGVDAFEFSQFLAKFARKGEAH